MPLINDTPITQKLAQFHALGKVVTRDTNLVGNEKYKSAHSVSSVEVWADVVPFAGDLSTAITNASGTSSIVTMMGTPSNPLFLYPLSGTDYQTWFLDTGTPSLVGFGFVPSSDWAKPLINISDVPNSAGAPSLGYQLLMYQRNGTPISYDNAKYDVDYYAGLIHFDPTGRPIDLASSNGLGFQFSKSGFESAVGGGFASAVAYLQSVSTGGPRSVAFKYTGIFLSDLAGNPAVGSEPDLLSLTPYDVASGTSTASSTQLPYNPVGEIAVFVNGQKQDLGYATTSQCFFGTQSTVARANESEVDQYDYLFWNADASNSFPLSTTDKLEILYNKPA